LTDPHVEYVAHHWILLAGPAFMPAVIVVGVVLYIAIRDRRRADDDAQRRDVEKHIVAVIAAHDKALRLLPTGHQLTGQLTMMLVMVSYTFTGLYLLFSA
jgi:hypothetical protein